MLLRFMITTTLLSIPLAVLLTKRAPAQPVDADLLLVGGTIIDGTGDPPYTGDVAIRGDEIVAVGSFDVGQVGERIECRGLVVAPGFIDLHNHSDDPILEDQTRAATCYLTQGCTTIVTGNCGAGAVNVARYYQHIDSNGAGVNVAHLFPQGALRDKVMGKVRRPPTAAELDEMRRLTDEAMREGAWGMTTGLQYVPSSYADTDEIVEIAKVVARHDGIYASHMRDEGDELLESIDETIEIGRRAELPVHISHLKSSKRRNWGKVRAAAKRIEAARAAGLVVTADQYPYNASSTSVAAMLLPDEEREGGEKATIERLKSAQHGPRLRQLVEDNLQGRGPIMIADIDDHPTWIGRMLTEIAEEEKRPLIDIAWEVLLTGGVAGVSFSMDENDVRYAMTLPFVATASDGSSKIDDGTRPHPRSFGTFTRKIGRYAVSEGLVPLQFAVRSSTGLPADILGLADRGYLRAGQKADVVVFDPHKLQDRATFQSPFETSEGIRRVLVNGRTVIVDGQFQDQLAGRALRKE